jgi:hypothetical protein
MDLLVILNNLLKQATFAFGLPGCFARSLAGLFRLFQQHPPSLKTAGFSPNLKEGVVSRPLKTQRAGRNENPVPFLKPPFEKLLLPAP